MKYAIVSKLGGELLEACNADYEDYKGFLKCPNCKEPVFLRKSHSRDGKTIESSFIHHKAIREVSVCELRVGRYTQEEVTAIASKARGQRITKLNISMWKYLKTNLCINLKQWSQQKKQLESIDIGIHLIDYAHLVLRNNVEFMTDDTLPRVQELLLHQDPRVGIIPEMKPFFDKFIKENKAHWTLHCKIAQEALELFISSNYFKEMRYRLISCMCHPTSLESVPSLLDLDSATEEWKIRFAAYVTLQSSFIFLTVDWIKIFDIH